jgi:hypothetical protein
LTWRLLSALASVTLLAACGNPAIRESADDAAVHADIASGSAVEVTFDGTVAADPQQVGTHEHLQVKIPQGDVIEVDHNTTLAPNVPAHAGDVVVVHGLLYIDPGPRPGVHCTHAHTSGGCPVPGWIELAGAYYE